MYKVHTSCPASASVWYIPISLCVWPCSARCGQALSCYLICPNSFTHLSSSARCGQVWSGAILLFDMSQFLSVSGQQCQAWSGMVRRCLVIKCVPIPLCIWPAAPGVVRCYLVIQYVPIPLCVWPAAPGAVRHSQALSCYLICPNSFTHLASSARCGQALPKSIVNSFLTSDHIIKSCFPQPPMTIMITHSCMLMSLASIMPTLFLLDFKAYKFTKLDGLNFYGSDGTSTKAQMCDGVTQDWIWSLFPPSLLRVPSDLWTHTMCCTLVTSYLLSPMARGIRMKLGYLAVRMTRKIGLGVMWTGGCKHAEVHLIRWYFYLNSFFDWDMVMKYHLRLAIGHMYAHNWPTNTYNTSMA